MTLVHQPFDVTLCWEGLGGANDYVRSQRSEVRGQILSMHLQLPAFIAMALSSLIHWPSTLPVSITVSNQKLQVLKALELGKNKGLVQCMVYASTVTSCPPIEMYLHFSETPL